MTTAQVRAPRSIMTPRGAILALLLAGVLFSSVYPIKRYFTVKHSIAQLQQDKQTLRDRQGELQRESTLLQTDSEAERIARANGYVYPGEIPFAVVAPKAAPSPLPRVAAAGLLPPEQTSRGGFFSRIWQSVVRAAHTIG